MSIESIETVGFICSALQFKEYYSVQELKLAKKGYQLFASTFCSFSDMKSKVSMPKSRKWVQKI